MFDSLISDSRIPIQLLLILLLHPMPSNSQSPPPSGFTDSGDDPNSFTGNFNPSMGVIVIVLISALFFMGFFSLYIRHCSDSDSPSTSTTRRLSAARSRRPPRGLDSSIIDSFPTFNYSDIKSLKFGKAALECAVCLNEFQDDETLRLIPKCDHVFHPECIDAWLANHTTCPVCRANLAEPGPVKPEEVAIEIAEPQQLESMEQPLNLTGPVPKLNRNRTVRNIFGKFSRSNSTGHVAVKQWENMERFTLRLPEEVRRQIMSGKLNRTTSCVVLPREGSSRRGNRVWTGFGEGSSSVRDLSGRFDRVFRSERWVFSLTPPFVTRAASVRSPRVAGSVDGSVRSTKTVESVHGFDSASEPKLPPV